MVMAYLKSLVDIKMYLWTFWVIGIFQNFHVFSFMKTDAKTTTNATEMEQKLKTNDTYITWTSNRCGNKYWMIGLDMLICCYGHVKVMVKCSHMETLVIDDGFLNIMTWSYDDLKTVLDNPNGVFNDTFCFFSIAQSHCFL